MWYYFKTDTPPVFLTLFLGFKAKTMLAKQPCCIQTKYKEKYPSNGNCLLYIPHSFVWIASLNHMLYQKQCYDELCYKEALCTRVRQKNVGLSTLSR